jgi:transglutaminase-like putative cysteine protease
MHLRIEHHTTYHYQSPVVQAQHLGHLQPRSWPHQQVLSHALQVQPDPAVLDSVLDSFGNWRVQFSLQTPHDTLHVHATTLIDTFGQPCITLPPSPGWTEVREHHRYHAQAPYDPTTEFVFSSPYVPICDTLADYAAGRLFTDREQRFLRAEERAAAARRSTPRRTSSTRPSTAASATTEKIADACSARSSLYPCHQFQLTSARMPPPTPTMIQAPFSFHHWRMRSTCSRSER